MCTSLTAKQEILQTLQSKVGKLLLNSPSMKIPWYKQVPSPARIEIEMRQSGDDDNKTDSESDRPNRISAVKYTHGDYHALLFDYSYDWLRHQWIFVDPAKMERRWPFPRDRLETADMKYCVTGECNSLWLLAVTYAALSYAVAPETAFYDLISQIFHQTNGFNTNRSAGGLRTDVEYLNYFVELRGMLRPFPWAGHSTDQADSEPAEHESERTTIENRFHLNRLTALEARELNNLLHWLIGKIHGELASPLTSTLYLEHEGPAAYVAKLVCFMGLRISVVSDNPPSRVAVRYAEYTPPRDALIEQIVVKTSNESEQQYVLQANKYLSLKPTISLSFGKLSNMSRPLAPD
jgi:hypothetical protein